MFDAFRVSTTCMNKYEVLTYADYEHTNLLPGGGTSIAYSTLKCLNIWLWLLIFVGFAKKHLNFNNSLLKYANEAVYPFYILHQTVIVVVGFYVVEWQASIALKFFVISTATFIITTLLGASILLCNSGKSTPANI